MGIVQSRRTRGSAAIRLGAAAIGLGALGALVGLGSGSAAPLAGPLSATGVAVTVRVLGPLAVAAEAAMGAVLVYSLWPERRRRRSSS